MDPVAPIVNSEQLYQALRRLKTGGRAPEDRATGS